MNLRQGAAIAATLLALAASPGVASADWVATPFVGPTFGADAGGFGARAVLGGTKTTYGGSLGYFSPGVLGLEGEIGYAPSFFEGNELLDTLVNSRLTTLMANVVVISPGRQSAGLRPYATGGVGLIRSEISDPLNLVRLRNNALGVNAGGGVMAFFNDRVGVRADVRYFRAVGDQSESVVGFLVRDLSFWRTSVGAAIRF